MVTNIRKSIFYTQHMRLDEVYDHRNPVHPSVFARRAGKYIVDKWSAYVTQYASNRGIRISFEIAQNVGYKVANRPFGTCPISAIKSALIAEIKDALN